MRRYWWLLAALLLLAACTGQGGNSTSKSGLGATAAEWEKAHGAATRGEAPQARAPVAYGSGLFVFFADDATGTRRVARIDRVWGAENAVTLETAQEVLKEFLPADAKMIRTDQPAPTGEARGARVDRYQSEQLRPLVFPGTIINTRPAGEIIVTYEMGNDRVGRLTIYPAE